MEILGRHGNFNFDAVGQLCIGANTHPYLISTRATL